MNDTTKAELVETSMELEPARSRQDLARTLQDMTGQIEVLQSFIQTVMIEDQDYGKIPGTEKPTLLKPGAEKLLNLYRYAPVVADLQIQQNEESGFMRALVVMRITRREDGVTVAEGVGEANTNESRHRWRWVWDNEAKALGLDPKTLPTKTFMSRAKKEFTKYRVDNDDPWTLWNTILKMAKKRALIDATLSATWTSGIFAQDIEDIHPAAAVPEPGGGEWAEPSGIASPTPTTSPQQASQPQLKMLAALGHNLGWDDAELHRQAGVESLKELTKQAASQLITVWKQLEKSSGGGDSDAPAKEDPPSSPSPEPTSALEALPEELRTRITESFAGRMKAAEVWIASICAGATTENLEAKILAALNERES